MMALSHKISDAVTMRVDKDEKGFSVIEIQFKFVRYRLTIDDEQNGERLRKLLTEILQSREKGVKENGKMPAFYKALEGNG